MLDIRYLRAEPQAAKEALARRGEDGGVVDALRALDEERRAQQTRQEALKADQNRLGPQIAQAKRSGGDAAELLARSTALKAEIQCLDETVRRPYGVYVHGNNDTVGAIRAIEMVTTGLQWRRAQEPVSVTGPPNADHLAACFELGAALAAGLM